jgi:hypothetical protein
MAEAQKKQLKPEVSAKYELIPGIGVGEVHFKGQSIQLDQIGVKEVEALVKQGISIFNEKTPSPAKA